MFDAPETTMASPELPTPSADSAAWHPRPIVVAHWATFGLLVAAFAFVLGREFAEGKALETLLLMLHRWAGLSIALLAFTRLLLRTRLRLAEGTSDDPAWQRWIAAGIHALLYLFMLGLPLLGWVLSSAQGQTVNLPWGGHLPALMEPDPDLADTLEDWHGTLAWIFAGLIGLHAAAALFHHWVRRDGVLAAMWPPARASR